MNISFVVPAYNEEAIVRTCLQSIVAEIARNPNLALGTSAEVVVVNNASTDNTRAVAEEFFATVPAHGGGLRVIDEPRKGLVQARKAGFDASTGTLVANIDSDTVLPQGWLAEVQRQFDTDKQLVALSGPFIFHDMGVATRALVQVFYVFGYVLGALRIIAMLQGGNFVLRRDAWVSVGGFNTAIAFYGEDTDVAKRLQRVGRVRWTWKLPAYTSGRRLQKEGVVVMSLRYTINNIWMFWFDRPFSKQYKDIRPK
jgi:glycosyltransferase involved in cell wall biosynthesis